MKLFITTMISTFILTLSIGTTLAKESKPKKLSKISTSGPLLNETVQVTPIDGHHFNLKAPQKCVKSSSDTENTINPTAKKIKCQYHSPGKKKITVSVCDDKEVYCKQEKYEVLVSANVSNEPRMKKSLHTAVASDQKKNKDLLMPGFKTATVVEAKKLSNYKDGLLVLVSTEWCPPCNMLKEFLLPTKEFRQLTQNFALVYVDGDGPGMDEWRDVVNSYYYPSMVILNHKMQVVDIIAGYPYIHEFKEFIIQANKNLKDPQEKLKERIENRIAGKKLQKLIDIFTSKSSIAADEKRWLDTLYMTGKSDESLKYLEKFASKDYAADIARARYENFDPEKNDNKDLEPIEEEVLRTPLKGKDYLNDYIYFSVVEKRCQNFLNKEVSKKSKKDKTAEKPKTFSNEKCKSIYSSLFKINDETLQEALKKLTPAEKIIQTASYHRKNSQINEKLAMKDKAAAELEKCLDNYDKLEAYTPLGSKSRAAGIYRSYCVDRENTDKNLELVLKLAKNYPYDSTFHSKLASLYMKKEQYQMALDSIEKALIYSYGSPWVKAVIQKSKILQKQKKKRAAFQTLKEALNEIVFEKDDKRTYWLDTLRKEYEALKAELKN